MLWYYKTLYSVIYESNKKFAGQTQHLVRDRIPLAVKALSESSSRLLAELVYIKY